MAAAEQMSNIGWETMVVELRGALNITATVSSIPHMAGRLIDVLRRRGAGVLTCTLPWSASQINQAAQRGAHKQISVKLLRLCV